MFKYWWLAPHKLILFFILPIYIFIYIFGPDINQSMFDGFRNFFVFDKFVLGFIFLIILSSFSYLGSKTKLRKGVTDQPQYLIKRKFLDLGIIFWITVFAYAVWFHGAFLNPDIVIQVLRGVEGAKYVFRDVNPTIAGITTLSQCGVVYVVLYGIYKYYYSLKLPGIYSYYFGIIVLLTFLRAVLWGERLALLELVIPYGVIYVGCQRFSGRKDFLFKYLPIFGLGLLVIFFGVTEYFRSWVNSYFNVYDSYTKFILDRLSLYYYTALNNGSGLLATQDYPHYTFYSILTFLYDMPILGNWLRSSIDLFNYSDFLNKYTDPEFNNPSAIFSIIYDLGIVGGYIFSSLYGYFVGYLYKSMTKWLKFGVYFYPIFLLSFFEILRVVYISSSRTFPILFILFVIFLVNENKTYEK